MTQLGTMLTGTAQLIVQLPAQAISAFSEIAPGSPRNMDGAISIVGLGQFSGELASNQDLSMEDKILSELAMIMSLNVALFVFNMIPLVPLDGGHIAGAVYESIKRRVWKLRGKKWERPVDTGQMTPVAYFVAVLLLALTVVLVIRDIVNPLQF
jgi:membrane-associated protease RseP (regulator of RpoE activity)